ncbi:MAG: ornithine carbamoyltransferase [Deltaproteobacteria bacterium]|nr:ornithine carbamoyltransferase [Deltaproteobacteria bacterium]MBQ7248757.1 ornithine carbamoyltransferase [Deltaproteobacteria bacterium]
MKKDFISIADWSREELEEIFALAADLKRRVKRHEPHPLLAGKSLGMIFEKSSTRTRVSFEVGMSQLGGHALFLNPQATQLGRGEPLKDTARVLSRYVDGIMIRTFAQETVDELARWASIPVINGLTDLLHPCQVMTDIFTVLEYKKSLKDLVFCWIGDGNNMANSWINAAMMLGFELRLATPEGYEPDAAIWKRALERGSKVTLVRDPLEAARGAHVLNTDVWASMGQEQEQQVRSQAFAGFQINARTLAVADPECLVLHCLPAHRGEEITEDVLEGTHSVVFDEAENRLHVQKAIMVQLMRNRG